MKKVTFIAINLAITNSIRGLAQILEKPIFPLTSVDASLSKGFSHFNQGLLLLIINNLRGFDYPAKNRSRAYTVQLFQEGVFPIS